MSSISSNFDGEANKCSTTDLTEEIQITDDRPELMNLQGEVDQANTSDANGDSEGASDGGANFLEMIQFAAKKGFAGKVVNLVGI